MTDIPKEVRSEMNFRFVSKVSEGLRLALKSQPCKRPGRASKK